MLQINNDDSVPFEGVYRCDAGDTGGDTADGGEGGSTEPGAPGVPWANKDHKQRMEYMGIVVLPEMKKVFQGYDATGFAQFK